MRIRTEFKDWDQLENAVYRSLSGVLGKRYRKTNQYISYILSKSIIAQIQSKHLVGIGNSVNITFDLSVNAGKVSGIESLEFREYTPCGPPTKFGNLKINDEVLKDMVIVEDQVLEETTNG